MDYGVIFKNLIIFHRLKNSFYPQHRFFKPFLIEVQLIFHVVLVLDVN